MCNGNQTPLPAQYLSQYFSLLYFFIQKELLKAFSSFSHSYLFWIYCINEIPASVMTICKDFISRLHFLKLRTRLHDQCIEMVMLRYKALFSVSPREIPFSSLSLSLVFAHEKEIIQYKLHLIFPIVL